jgi:DNA-binding MarR family transcriptional regulator
MNSLATTASAALISSPSETDAKGRIVLDVLKAVEENSAVTQRSLARDLGIALGLANAYLKRCVTKGYIKVTHAPAKRYVYYLTPQGFAEKSRLTAQYLAISFDFFRLARSQCSGLFAECETRGWARIALCGAGELAEIAILCAENHVVTLIGLVETPGGSRVGKLPLVGTFAELANPDAVVITDQRTPQQTHDRIIALLPRERVLAPRLLNISRTPPRLAE